MVGCVETSCVSFGRVAKIEIEKLLLGWGIGDTSNTLWAETPVVAFFISGNLPTDFLWAEQKHSGRLCKIADEIYKQLPYDFLEDQSHGHTIGIRLWAADKSALDQDVS